MLLRRQHRIHDRDLPLRLKIILDESALRRLVGSPDITRNQLEHLNTLGTQPHITVQVLPHTAGAHPGLSGPFCILRFPGSPEAEMYLERFTSHLHLRKPSEVQHQSPVPAGHRACGVPPGAAARPRR
ncbi:Scr1 family TA system antitoxin-like transcriptional regulator [Streptomyces massasporeus]|uniref:Scr1 family TA system antitoxin-like transcriptional regulator n=1 Tax=Streptomyces massasporeus TaxID=67324 RepID=UPI0033CB853D